MGRDDLNFGAGRDPVQKRRRNGRRQPQFWSGIRSCAEAAAGGRGEAAGDLQASGRSSTSLEPDRRPEDQDLRGRRGEKGRRRVTLQRVLKPSSMDIGSSGQKRGAGPYFDLFSLSMKTTLSISTCFNKYMLNRYTAMS